MPDDEYEVDPFDEVMRIVAELKSARIHHSVELHRDQAISIIAVVPGEYWEIDVLDDGSVMFEVFRSNGSIKGVDAMHERIKFHAEPEAQEE